MLGLFTELDPKLYRDGFDSEALDMVCQSRTASIYAHPTNMSDFRLFASRCSKKELEATRAKKTNVGCRGIARAQRQ